MASRMAIITFIDGGPIDPGFGQGGSPNYPGNALPFPPYYPGNSLPISPGHPGNALPPPGSIATLPVFPFDPTIPSNELPGPQPEPTPPIQIRPGAKFVVKWLACQGLILVPDNTLPETPEPK